MFLVSTPGEAARPILDRSPRTPPMRLYSAADVLTTIPQDAQLIKVDLKSGFLQVPILRLYLRYCGAYYRRQYLAWTHLPMGRPLAPSVMQVLVTAVARRIHRRHSATMATCLHDWLFYFDASLPVATIIQDITQLGFTANSETSMLHPTTVMIHLGLVTDPTSRTLQDSSSRLRTVAVFLGPPRAVT
jgi:hypothetical protein